MGYHAILTTGEILESLDHDFQRFYSIVRHVVRIEVGQKMCTESGISCTAAIYRGPWISGSEHSGLVCWYHSTPMNDACIRADGCFIETNHYPKMEVCTK